MRTEYRGHVIEVRADPSLGSPQTVYDVWRRMPFGGLTHVLAGFCQGAYDGRDLGNIDLDCGAVAERMRAKVDEMAAAEPVRPGMLRNQGTSPKQYLRTIDTRGSLP